MSYYDRWLSNPLPDHDFTLYDLAGCGKRNAGMSYNDRCMILQGAAADWARERLETGYYEREGRLQRIRFIDQRSSQALEACTKIIAATGFKRSRLPVITVDGIPLRYPIHNLLCR